jgi:hypothetical protein
LLVFFSRFYLNFLFKSGKITMDSNIGRNLMKIIDSIPMLDVQTFDTLMTNQMNVIIFFSH